MTSVIRIAAVALALCTALPALAQNDERPNRRELLDNLYAPEVFGSTLRWFGVVDSTVVLDPTCVFPPGEGLSPRERCVVLAPAPAQTNWDEREIASITVPGNTVHDVICPVLLNLLNYQLHNNGSAPANARLDYRVSITLESEALQDPTAIDPVTGIPLAGKLQIPWGRRLVQRTLAPSASDREILQYTRECNAGATRSQLEAQGVSRSVWNRMVRQPLTIHLGIAGSARLVDSGVLTFSMRLTGN